MGILLSRLQNQGPIESNKILEPNGLVDVTVTNILLENWIEELPKLDAVMLECVQGIYFGLKDKNHKLVVEGSFDLAEKSVSWFDKHISTFNKQCRDSIKKIRSVAKPYQNISNKNLNIPTNITIKTNIHKYSITADNVNLNYANEFTMQLVNGLIEIDKASTYVELQANAAKLKSMFTGDDALNHIRGKLVNCAPHGTADYKDNLYNFFRSGGIATVEEFNTNRARGILLQFKSLDKILTSLEKDAAAISKLAKLIGSVIKDQIRVVNKRVKDKLSYNLEIIDDPNYKYNLALLKNRVMFDLATNFIQSLKKLIMVYELYVSNKLDAVYEMVRKYGKLVHILYGGEK